MRSRMNVKSAVAVGIHLPDQQQGAAVGDLPLVAVALTQLAGGFELEADADALASAAGAEPCGGAHDCPPTVGGGAAAPGPAVPTRISTRPRTVAARCVSGVRMVHGPYGRGP